MARGQGDGLAPEDTARRLWAAWADANIDELSALVTDDVVVSGHLADGRPLHGRSDVMEMVRSFAASGSVVRLSELEPLSDASVVFRASVESADGPSDVAYWVWTFQDGLLDDSHAFASRDAAITWFAAEDPARPPT
jgi:hypothetical protein